jgi:hypothetical protein
MPFIYYPVPPWAPRLAGAQASAGHPGSGNGARGFPTKFLWKPETRPGSIGAGGERACRRGYALPWRPNMFYQTNFVKIGKLP